MAVMISATRLEKRCENAARAARELVARHIQFGGRVASFQFECSDNVLTVRGRVPTFYLKQLLQNLLKEVSGVERIDNRVEVVSTDGLSSWQPK